MRLLFIHGLEGHPNGTKVVTLREQGFEVLAADMHMSLWALGKRNSAARNLLRLEEVRFALGLGVVGGGAARLLRWRTGGWAIPALSAGWLYTRRHALMGRALERSLATCVAIQREAIETHRPDVVIGSSWGGAVAAELIADGSWTGPTVLLAPAIERVRHRARRTRRVEPSVRDLAKRERVIVFHDPSDSVVPHADSLRLVAGSSIELRSVDAGGHRLLELLERGELAETLRQLDR